MEKIRKKAPTRPTWPPTWRPIAWPATRHSAAARPRSGGYRKEARRPYATAKDAPTDWYGSSDARFIKPVSFDAHCTSCHTQTALPIPAKGWTLAGVSVKDTFKEEFNVSHVDLSLVRSQVESDLREVHGQQVRVSRNQARRARHATGGGRRRAGKRRTRGAERPAPVAGGGKPAEVAVKLPQADWLRIAAVATAKRTNDLLKENTERYKARGLEGQTLAEPAAGDEVTPGVLADYYTAYIAVSSCIQCHDLEGNLPGVKGASENVAERLRTVPTGIPSTPRRWFADSTFDHFAHRQMDCRGCHAPAWTSEATENVLTADIDGRYSGAAALNVTAAGESCVSCHHADTKARQRAPGQLRDLS